MRQVMITVISVFIISNVSAQTEKSSYKTIADNFQSFYNSNKIENIFSMFSAEMQDFLPLDKTRTFFSELRSEAGKIIKKKFIKYESTYAVYKTNFERTILAVNISVDGNSKIKGLFIKTYTDESLPKMGRNSTKLKLPFNDEWTVVWGGDTKELNHHVESIAQKNAFDLVITDSKRKSYKTTGYKNEDYYAFGKPIIAPCDGEIVSVIGGVKDNTPGVLNPSHVSGNTVIIKTDKSEFLFFAHFKQNSIKVKQGQRVRYGQLLGLCGNSGNSSEPHLHFHIQNGKDMNASTGVKCYFDKLIVNGRIKTDYSPIKNDKIRSQ